MGTMGTILFFCTFLPVNLVVFEMDGVQSGVGRLRYASTSLVHSQTIKSIFYLFMHIH